MDVDMNSIISETKKSQNDIRKTIKNVVLITFLVFGITILPLTVMGISNVTVNVVPLFGMLYFFPMVTFFLGMVLVWKKKFSTLVSTFEKTLGEKAQENLATKDVVKPVESKPEPEDTLKVEVTVEEKIEEKTEEKVEEKPEEERMIPV